MEIPFSLEAFLGVFERYNLAIQPAQILAYLLGVMVIFAAVVGGRYSGRFILAALALFWAWVGGVYHIGFFSQINPAAYFFGGLFIAQATLLLYASSTLRPRFCFTLSPAKSIGALFVIYAIFLYPLLNYVFGHTYPRMPVFGITPCPLTIFTLGILLWSETRIPLYLLAIPFLWSLIGVSAAIQLGITEDYGLVVAGLAGSLLIALRNREIHRRSPAL